VGRLVLERPTEHLRPRRENFGNDSISKSFLHERKPRPGGCGHGFLARESSDNCSSPAGNFVFHSEELIAFLWQPYRKLLQDFARKD